MSRSVSFTQLMLFATLASTLLGVWLIRGGNPWVGLLPFVLSLVAIGLIRHNWEPTMSLVELYSPKIQSWSMLFGDSLALTSALACIALSWRKFGASNGFHHSMWWSFASIVLAAIGVALWRSFQISTYTSLGLGALTGSPSMKWHDYVVVGCLGFLLIWGGIPALFYDLGGAGKWALLFFVVWFGLAVADGRRDFDYARLHPPVEETFLAP